MAIYYPDVPDTEVLWPAMIVPKDQYDERLKDQVDSDQLLLYFFESKMVKIF